MKEKDYLDNIYTSSDSYLFEESEKWLYSYVLIGIDRFLQDVRMRICETCVKKEEISYRY